MKIGFSSPHGDFSFSITSEICLICSGSGFSSPHGDFSFSILSHIPLINQGLFL